MLKTKLVLALLVSLLALSVGTQVLASNEKIEEKPKPLFRTQAEFEDYKRFLLDESLPDGKIYSRDEIDFEFYPLEATPYIYDELQVIEENDITTKGIPHGCQDGAYIYAKEIAIEGQHTDGRKCIHSGPGSDIRYFYEVTIQEKCTGCKYHKVTTQNSKYTPWECGSK